MSDLKFIVLGFKQRGLWLATELAKKNGDVTWMNILNVEEDADFPWQFGSQEEWLLLEKSQQEFIKKTNAFKSQRGFQILTTQGPFEFASEFSEKGLDYFFKDSKELILSYFDSIHKKQTSLSVALENKISKLPLSKRWLLEWVTSLPANLEGRFKTQTIENRTDPLAEQLLFDSSLKEGVEKALGLAEQAGVKIISGAKILDIGLDGSKISGVEIEHVKGFVPCDHLILSIPAGYLHDRWPHVAKKMREGQMSPKSVWCKFSFEVKPQTKPHGLYEFSSYIIDPYIPFEGSNFGLLLWGENNILDVWCKLSYEEAKKASVLKSTSEEVKRNLIKLLPSFEESCLKTLPCREDISAIKNRFLYSEEQKREMDTHKKNLWFAGPETDQGLSLISSLQTEKVILNQIITKYIKEPKGDRKIHSTRDGEAVVSGT